MKKLLFFFLLSYSMYVLGDDVSSDWDITETVDGRDCDEGIFTISDRATVLTKGKNLTITYRGVTANDALQNGNNIAFTISFSEDQGVTTSKIALAVNGNNLSGDSHWIWSNGADSCIGTSSIVGKKISSPTNTQASQTPTNPFPIPALASASFTEPNNTPEQASPILVNDTPVQQLLDSKDDVDWYEFYAQAGKRYSIEIPYQSIGKSINPAIQLYDKVGNSLSDQITRVSVAQSLVIQITAPATDLYRIRIINQPPFTKIAEVDNGYQLRVYLTDAPQQGLVKGFVLNTCNQQGIGKAEVVAMLGNGVSDSTLSHKTGEFGLLLNPGQYQLKSSATNFRDTEKGVSVSQLENNPVQFDQSPSVSCQDYVTPPTDPILQQQQAVAIYDENTGLLIIRDLWAGTEVYYAELQHVGNMHFQLSRVLKLPGTIHSVPGEYSYSSLVAKLPTVFALGKTWKIQMQNDGTWLFSMTQSETK